MFTVPKSLKTTPAFGFRRNKGEETMVENWQHSLDYNTEKSYDCDDGCDPYCRCGYIASIEVNQNISGIQSFFNSYAKYGTELDEVLDFWFTRKNFKSIEWGFEACSGYYGQEMDRIFVENDNGFFENAATFAKMSSKEKVEYLLIQEYMKLLPGFKEVNEWTIKKVPVKNIIKSINDKFNDEVVKNYVTYCQSHTWARRGEKITSNKFVDKIKNLAPLCISKDGIHYQLIDGRHRFKAMTERQFTGASFKDNILGSVERFPLVVDEIWILCPKEE